MKKLCLAALTCLMLATSAHAADLHEAVRIPDRYLLLEVTVSPEEKAAIDSAYMEGMLKKQRADAKVTVAQMAFYVQGQDTADGPFFLIEDTEGSKDVVFYNAESSEDALLFSKLLGYPTSVKELVDAYKDNEVVADEDFKGKPVVFMAKIPEVSKDMAGKPYIVFPYGQYKLEGVMARLSMDDPLLRKVKRGSEVIIRGVPKRFVMQQVVLDSEIVKIQPTK